MPNGESAANLDTVAITVPRAVLAGGFIVVDGFHVVPIPNGVMQPGRAALTGLAAMFVVEKISDAAIRNQIQVSLADNLIAAAQELKRAVTNRALDE